MLTLEEFQQRLAHLSQQHRAAWPERLASVLELLTLLTGADWGQLVLVNGDFVLQHTAQWGEELPSFPMAVHWPERFSGVGLLSPTAVVPGWTLPFPSHTAIPVGLLFCGALSETPSPETFETAAALLSPLLLSIVYERQLEKNLELEHRHRYFSEALKKLDPTLSISALLAEVGELSGQVLPVDHLLLFSTHEDAFAIHYIQGFSEAGAQELLRAYQHQLAMNHTHTHTLLHVTDVWEDLPALAAVAHKEDFRTFLSLPFQIPERRQGALLLARTQTQPFTLPELSLALTFVNQAALTLYNEYLFRQERSQRELSQALAEAASALTRFLELDQVLDEILVQLQRVVPHDASNIMLIEEGYTCAVRWRGYEAFECEEVVRSNRFPLQAVNIRRMLEKRSPLVVADTHADPEWVCTPGLEWLRSYAAAPIIIGNEVVGLINVDSQYPGFFNATHVQPLRAFADYATIALKNARFFEDARNRQSYLEGLNAVISAVNQALNLDDILQLGLERALHFAEMERGGLYLWNPRDEQLQLRVSQGLAEDVVARVRVYRSGEGLTGKAFSERRALLAPDVGTLRADIAEEQAHFIKAQISLPLLVEGQAVGVMSLNRPHGRPITAEAELLLRAIADQLAVAVQRGQLASQLQEQLSAVQHLYETSAALLVQTNTRAALFLLLRTLHDLLQKNVIALAFYCCVGAGWERTRVYYNRDLDLDAPPWLEGVVWEDEGVLLEQCHQARHVMRITALDADSNAYWEQVTAVGARQALYFPLHLPTGESLGVVGLLLCSEDPLAARHYAAVMALLQQGTATLSRVRLYEQSMETESRLRAILESSQDGILLIGQQLAVQYVNGRAMDLLTLPGFSAEWERRVFSELIAAVESCAPQLAQWLARSARQLESPTLAGEQATPTFTGAQERQIQVYHWPVYAHQDALQGSLFVLRDVTEQKALERMRDDLLHMLVHDMRNPLSIIQNALQIMDDPTLHTSIPDITNLALRNTDRLLTLVHAILDIGRMETGRFQLRQGVIALRQIIEALKGRIQVASNQTVFEVNVPTNLPKLWADPEVVERIFHNLIDNAFKFIPRKGGVIRITATHKGEWVTIEVYNNGKPIPEDMKERLFKKFSAGEYRGQGYGLGLAFCRLAVEAHGGKIYPENHTEGVSFYFTLPVTGKGKG